MAKRRAVPGVHPYDGPAGGWGALKATAIAVRTQMDTLEAPVTLMRTNQPDGFDCPGCAWPDKEHRSTFQFCENGAKAVTWEATSKRVTPEFLAQNTVTSLLQKTDYLLEDYGRLTTPLCYDAGTDTLRPLAWDEAFQRIAAVLQTLPPEQVEFYTSGRASNEAAYLFQLFAREFGSNNFPDCSNMCHEPTSVGLPQSIGIGKGTVSLDDFDSAELIISIGHNPGTNHPRMMGTLHELARKKVPIIVFNPLRERALERFTDPQNVIEMATYSSTLSRPPTIRSRPAATPRRSKASPKRCGSWMKHKATPWITPLLPSTRKALPLSPPIWRPPIGRLSKRRVAWRARTWNGSPPPTQNPTPPS